MNAMKMQMDRRDLKKEKNAPCNPLIDKTKGRALSKKLRNNHAVVTAALTNLCNLFQVRDGVVHDGADTQNHMWRNLFSQRLQHSSPVVLLSHRSKKIIPDEYTSQ